MNNPTTVLLFLDTLKQHRDSLAEALRLIETPHDGYTYRDRAAALKIRDTIRNLDVDIRNAKRLYPVTADDYLKQALTDLLVPSPPR